MVVVSWKPIIGTGVRENLDGSIITVLFCILVIWMRRLSVSIAWLHKYFFTEVTTHVDQAIHNQTQDSQVNEFVA